MTSDINRRYLDLQYAIIENNGVQCQKMPDLFFPEGPEMTIRYDIEAARLICIDCPVFELCRDYARSAKEPFGIWAAETPEERAISSSWQFR
jgi:hypothetical protein